MDPPEKNILRVENNANEEEQQSVVNEDDKLGEKWNSSWRTTYKVVATFYGFIVLGMFDSSLGALIPRIEKDYDLSYLIVSLAFLAQSGGAVCAAVCSDFTHRLIGRRGSGALGIACQIVCFTIAVSGPPPFPVFAVGYAIGGLGNGLIDASWNAYIGSFQNANELAGILHAFYGAGGIICPTVFTAMMEAGKNWHICYAVLLGMDVLAWILFTTAFIKDGPTAYKNTVEASRQEGGNANNSSFRVVVKSKLVWLLAFGLFLYVGSEVSLGGWISTFMIQIRDGDPEKMGYVTTGFWTGITVGRVVLGFVTGYLKHEELMATIYLSSAILFVLLFWLVPSFLLSAISAGVIGFFLGPLFPIVVVVAIRKLPRWLHVGGVGFAAALGGCGAAFMPFINGAISNTYGPRILGPFVFSLLSAMLIIWLIVLKFF